MGNENGNQISMRETASPPVFVLSVARSGSTRHGKRRWCDKSLDSARLADLLAHVYPEAQFICLYRHAMDAPAAAGAKPRGFVPRAGALSLPRHAGVRPFTATGRGSHTCYGVHGTGLHISYIDEHFFNTTGCHIGHIWLSSYNGYENSWSSGKYICSHQDYEVQVNLTLAAGGGAYGNFNNVPPAPSNWWVSIHS